MDWEEASCSGSNRILQVKLNIWTGNDQYHYCSLPNTAYFLTAIMVHWLESFMTKSRDSTTSNHVHWLLGRKGNVNMKHFLCGSISASAASCDLWSCYSDLYWDSQEKTVHIDDREGGGRIYTVWRVSSYSLSYLHTICSSSTGRLTLHSVATWTSQLEA